MLLSNIVKLKVIELGPVRNSEIELGHVTILFGPPNTGKSYLLKALYSQLITLDRYQVALAKRLLCSEVRQRIEYITMLVRGVLTGSVKVRDSYKVESGYASIVVDENRRWVELEVRLGGLEVGEAVSVNLALSLVEQLPQGVFQLEPSYAAYVTYPDLSDVCRRACPGICTASDDGQLVIRVRVGDAEWFAHCLARLLKRLCSGVRVVPSLGELSDAAFIPFGRTPLVYLVDAASAAGRDAPMSSTHQMGNIYAAYLARLWDGYRRFLRNPDDEVSRAFSLFGRFEARGGRILYSSRGPPVEIPRASAMAAEVLGIMLPIYASRKDALVLVEEPEAQLHPAAHILMAVALLASAGLGYRLVITTHSEQLVATVAGFAGNSAGIDDLASLVIRAAELAHVSVDRSVARYVATMALSAAERGVEFYYLNGAGVRRVDRRDIIEKEYSIQYLLDNELSKILIK